MNSMSFGEAFTTYYTMILDLTIFLGVFFVAFGLSFAFWPKSFNKKEILFYFLKLLAIYASLIFVQSFMFALSNVIAANNSTLRSVIFSLATPLVVVAAGLIFIRGYKLHKFLKILIMFSTVIICDVISKNLGHLFVEGPHEFNIWLVLARSTPFLLSTCMGFLIYKVNINRYKNLFWIQVFAIIFISSLLIGISAQEHMIEKTDTDFIILLSLLDLLLVFLLGVAYFSIYKNIENRHKITNLEVQKTLAEAETTAIAIDKVNREELEKIRHDIKNQFSYLDFLLQQGKYEEAKNHIEELLDDKQNVLNSFSCSNEVINSIINLELTKAKIQNIEIDVKAVVPPKLPFKDIDLVSLITNSIDNALENYYSPEHSPIIVRIVKQNDYIRFMISNPINPENVNISNITKTKKDGRGHGYGTKIIRNIASAYNGYADFSIEDNRFISDVVLNLNQEEKENV